jgi:hypothetical protein
MRFATRLRADGVSRIALPLSRAAFNSNNASAVPRPPPPAGASSSAAAATSSSSSAASASSAAALAARMSAVVRTYLRRAAAFPPVTRGMPRNPKWALRVPAAAAALAARGPHALALQIHNVWDRANCSRCSRPAALFSAGLTPEIDPCAGYYAREEVKAAPEGRCTRNWCTGKISGGAAEDVLKIHHYVLPRGGKSYRRGGAGDAGGKRDVWEGDVADADALRFAP